MTLVKENDRKYSPLRYVSHDIIKYEHYLSALVMLGHFLCHVFNDEVAGAK